MLSKKWAPGYRDSTYTLQNLVSDSNPLFEVNKDFQTWNTLYSRKEGYRCKNKNVNKRGKQYLAYLIARIFFRLVLEDLINLKTTFKFPYPNFIRVRIAKIMNKRRKGYRYNIKTQGDEYCMFFIPGIYLFASLKHAIYFKLSPKYHKMVIDNVVNNGYQYPDGEFNLKINRDELSKIRKRRRSRLKNKEKNKEQNH